MNILKLVVIVSVMFSFIANNCSDDDSFELKWRTLGSGFGYFVDQPALVGGGCACLCVLVAHKIEEICYTCCHVGPVEEIDIDEEDATCTTYAYRGGRAEGIVWNLHNGLFVKKVDLLPSTLGSSFLPFRNITAQKRSADGKILINGHTSGEVSLWTKSR